MFYTFYSILLKLNYQMKDMEMKKITAFTVVA